MLEKIPQKSHFLDFQYSVLAFESKVLYLTLVFFCILQAMLVPSLGPLMS